MAAIILEKAKDDWLIKLEDWLDSRLRGNDRSG
jgi:hypothetical protein